MDLKRKYCQITRSRFDRPEKAVKWIRFGAEMQYKRWKFFPDRKIPASLQLLNRYLFQFLYESLRHPHRAAYVNLFAPCEILHSFGIFPMFVESIATFLSGFYCEDLLIEKAESIGIAETLCSFHKTFLGAIEMSVLPKPLFAISSSVLCDANTKTFSHIADRLNIPNYIIDVPYQYSRQAVGYVLRQLEEMISMIEGITNQKLQIDKLRKILETENRTKKLMQEYLVYSASRAFPNHVTLEMSRLMLTHTGIGREETFRFFELLSRDIRKAPKRTGKSIFWIQVLPFFDPTVRKIFNYNPNFQLIAMDLNFDDLEPLSLENPLQSLAEKMLKNVYNGEFQRRIDWILHLLELTKPDGVVYFCQWGCKQSTGGSTLMIQALKNAKMPFLLLDGDAADRKNMPQGQIKTRLEAFLEMLR